MKKSLIALAVLATTGTAFAQSTVTLSGKFGGAYESGSQTVTTAGVAAAGVSTNGFRVSDGNVTFAALEDIGGGMKAGVSMDVRVRGRIGAAGGSVEGRDASVFVGGGFGTVTVGSIESRSGIYALANAGAPVQDLADVTTLTSLPGIADATQAASLVRPLSAPVNLDALIYNTPKYGDFTGTLLLGDSLGNPGVNGGEDTSATQDVTLLGVSYASGPLAAVADYSSFGANGLNTATAYRGDSRVRLSASYDLGVAKLGVGYQTQTSKQRNLGVQVAGAADLTVKEYVLGVSAPLSKEITVGANYVRRSADDNTTLAFTGHNVTAWDFGVKYSLSKRTNVQADYRTINAEATTAAGLGKVEDRNLFIRLLHSF